MRVHATDPVAGLDPAIHVFLRTEDVDARDKPGARGLLLAMWLVATDRTPAKSPQSWCIVSVDAGIAEAEALASHNLRANFCCRFAVVSANVN